MSLKQEVLQLLNNVKSQCEAHGNADYILNSVNAMLERLNQPLRVAVVGVMKAGKSTLMNALLKEKILVTGKLETTYTVTWFRYAPQASIEVRFRNGDSLKNVPLTDIEKWTTRQTADGNRDIDAVDYVIIFYPNELLKQIELIDTPGLNSFYKTDAENTERLIGQAEEDTKKHASMADAVLYTFHRSMGELDRDFLERFQGYKTALKTSPINGLGILTRSDNLWNMEDDAEKQAIELGRRVTNQNMKDPIIKQLVYTILPTACIMEEGAVSLTNDDWSAIEKMANIETGTLCDLMFMTEVFKTKEQKKYTAALSPYIGTAKQRARLISLLSQYGLFEFIRCVKCGMERDEILEAVYERSGTKAVWDLLQTHFGNRALLIKANYIFRILKEAASQGLEARGSNEMRRICSDILCNVEQIEMNEQRFRELSALQDFYNGKFDLNEDELKEFLRITGEYGKHCEDRLGVKSPLRIHELCNIAKEREAYWRGRAAAFAVSPAYIRAAAVAADSYGCLRRGLQDIDEI